MFGLLGRKYKIDYNGTKFEFRNAKDSYRAGAMVKLIYNLIDTDTNYYFYMDGEEIHPHYSETTGYVLSFIMPEHDVKIDIKTTNSMEFCPEAKINKS